MAEQFTRPAGSFGEVQRDGQANESPTVCSVADSGNILLDDLLPCVTAERALPQIALLQLPELKGTTWHRIGWRTACTALAHVLLGTEGDERISAFAHRLAHVITAEGKATALDGKVLVTGDGTATAFGERTLYVMRCDR